MKPFYHDEFATIYHGDCREVMEELNSIYDGPLASMYEPWHCVTDPPYGIGLDYGETRDNWRPGAEVWRAIHSLGVESLHLTVSNRHLPDWLFEAKVGGWDYLHTSVYWNDTRAGGNANGQFAYAWEPLLHFRRHRDAPFRLGTRQLTDVYRHKGYRETDHPAERCPGVWDQVVGILPQGGILDPFMGVGTTLLSAKNQGRDCIGIEREEKWCEVAANRLSQGALFAA